MPRTDPSVQALQHNARERTIITVAAAGATQGNAAQLPEGEVVLATATTSAQGLKLPRIAGQRERITVVAMSNRGVKVYPWTGQRLTGAATNAAVTVPLNRAYTFYSDGGTLWRLERGAAA